MPKIKFGPCELCGRERRLTFHHLIPRTVHSNKWFKKNFTREQMHTGINICRECHNVIHKEIPSEKELAREFNTKEKLLAHPEIQKYIYWVTRRSPNS